MQFSGVLPNNVFLSAFHVKFHIPALSESVQDAVSKKEPVLPKIFDSLIFSKCVYSLLDKGETFWKEDMASILF